MKLPILKHVVAGWLCAGSIAAIACSEGRSLPTGPSATASVAASGNQHSMSQAVASSPASSPIERLYLTKNVRSRVFLLLPFAPSWARQTEGRSR